MAEKLTSLAKRLRPFIAGQISNMIASSIILSPNELNKIIYLPLTGAAVLYTKTAANLTTALAGSSDGEIVQINGPCTLAGDFSVPVGVVLRSMTRAEDSH